MAKLIGVKPIDMVNGDITKIEYNGEVYEKVGTDSPQVGDIGMIIDAWGGLIDGDYYEVTDVKNNDGRTYPGLGDGIYGCVEDKDTMFFRKVDSLLDGLTEVDSPQIGGFLTVTNKYVDDVTAGKPYEIVDIDSFGYPQFLDDEGDRRDSGGFYVSGYYVKATEESPQAVKAGDIIEMTTGDFWGEFIKGDQFEVKGESEEPDHLYIIDNNGDRRYILKYDHLKYKVVEAAEEAPAEELFAKVNRPDNDPIVGDFVEFDLSDYDKPYFKVGKKYEVDEDKDVIDEEGHVLPLYNSNRPIKSIFVKYTQEQAEQVAEVGDKILIVDEDVITHGYSNGDVVEVMDEFRSGDVKGDGTCIIFPREYIVLTDAQAGCQGEQSEDVAEKVAEASAPYSDLEVGDKVMVVIAKGQEPQHGWGGYVNNNDIGTVVEIGTTPLYDDDKMVTVDFPERKGWYAKQSELIKVAEKGDFLPGTVVKGDLSEEIYTIGERRLDRDGVYGKAYYVEGEGNAWVGVKQFEVIPKGEALRKLRIKTAVAEAKRQFEGSKIEVGDLVKVVKSPNALPTGSYFIVKSVDSEGYLSSTLDNGKLTRGGYRYKPERVELIAKAADVYV